MASMPENSTGKTDYKTIRVPQQPTIFKTVGGIASYPRPKALWDDVLTPYRPLLGVLPPPNEPARPEPSRPAMPPPPPGWRRANHAASAAYPRLYREGHGDLGIASFPWGPIPPNEIKEDKSARIDGWTETLVRGRYDAKPWNLVEAKKAAPPKQWISVERWVREAPTGGYTLICTHAGGLQKEHWQEIIREIITSDPERTAQRFGGGALKSPHHVVIDEVWMMDDLHHNESVYLSEGRLGPLQSWEDTGRDVLNLVEHVIPTTRLGEDADWDLGWDEKPDRRRKVLALGQSFGGAAIIHAAHARPDLFDAIFLSDPVPVPWYTPRERGYADPIKAYPVTPVVLKRRDVWASYAEARALLRASPFFAVWSEQAFEVYLARGLVPVDRANPNGPVTLATPAWAEACVFTEPEAGARAWDKIPLLKVPVGWVMAGNSATTRGDGTTQQMVWRAPRTRNERWLNGNHLLNQEMPLNVAQSLWRFLATYDSGEWDQPDPATGKL